MSDQLSPSRPGRFDEVHSSVLRHFPELVAELGGNPDRLLQRNGIADDGSCFTYNQLVDLLEGAARDLSCPDFGMRLAHRQNGTSVYGPLGPVVRNCKTYGDALRYVSRHAFAHSLAAKVWLSTLGREEGVFVGHDILLERTPGKCQALEQMLLLGHLGAMEITGGVVRARRVHLRHQPVSTPGTYRRYFGCDVRFGQDEDGLLYSLGDLRSAVVGRDTHAYDLATATLDAEFPRRKPPVHAEVRGSISRFLSSPACTKEQVAGDLNLHVRTLSRLLRAAGTSFQEIKDEIRRERLLYYLFETSLSLSCISEKLGFSEQAIMTRKCQHWFGTAPRTLRRDRHSQAPTC